MNYQRQLHHPYAMGLAEIASKWLKHGCDKFSNDMEMLECYTNDYKSLMAIAQKIEADAPAKEIDITQINLTSYK